MRLTSAMMNNTTLLHINRNMRNLDRIIRQTETGKRVTRPSDDPIIASRALMFRTSVHENLQFERNADQGVAWMNVTESTFMNINTQLLFEIRNLAVRGANGDNYLTNKQTYVEQMRSLFNQVGHEINQTFAGNYLFSGFRTNEPPMFTQNNNRSFIITQHFNLADISREASWQRLPNADGLVEPVTHNVNVLRLAFSGLDMDDSEPPRPIIHIPGFTIQSFSINDPEAYLPPDTLCSEGRPIMHFILETGELVLHTTTANQLPREGISVTYQRTGFREGDINPKVYFTGREIVTDPADRSHVPVGTELIYNVTQYFSRAAGELYVDADTNERFFDFPLHFPVYEPTPPATLPVGLTAMLSTDDVADITTNPAGEQVVRIPAHIFNSESNISITYPVRYDPATTPNIMTDINVQGVELVRALSAAGVPLPLDQIELNHSFNQHNQEIQYEFATRTHVTVNSLAKNVVTDKMFADFRRFFELADSIQISDRRDLEIFFGNAPDDDPPGQGLTGNDLIQAVDAQLIRENGMAREALHNQFSNLLFLIDRHVTNAEREHTELGARMVRMELIQSRIEQDYVSYNTLVSDNEDTDLIRAMVLRFAAEAQFQASLRANSGIIQLSIANFLG